MARTPRCCQMSRASSLCLMLTALSRSLRRSLLLALNTIPARETEQKHEDDRCSSLCKTNCKCRNTDYLYKYTGF